MAHTDYFLVIDTVDGETHDHVMKAKKAIDVLSWSWGETNASQGHTSGGHGAGKVAVQDLHFAMSLNKASPKLLLACCDGTHFKKASLYCRKQGGKQEIYLEMDFTDLVVTSFQTGGHGGDLIPTDQVSMNFATYDATYFGQDQKGAVSKLGKAGYDVKGNKKL